MKKHIFASALTAAMLSTMFVGSMNVHAEEEYSICIIQIDQIDLLDNLTLGFEDAVLDGLGDEMVLFDEVSADGDVSAYASIMEGFVSDNNNLIFVSSDEMLSAAVSATSSIPIIGTNIYNFSSVSASNLAGIASLAPYGEQADLLRATLPDAQTVGIIYSDGDAFSKEQADGMTTSLTNLGLTVTSYPFKDNLEAIVSDAVSACDVIYLPVDAAITSNASVIASACVLNQKPVITADETTCALCGLAVSSTDSYELGYEAGQMAVKVLKGEDISSIGIKSPTIRLRKYNEQIADTLGIIVPDDFESIENVSVENEQDGIEEMTEEEIEQFESETEPEE